MAFQRVLIVGGHSELRRSLRRNLGLLSPEIQVADVPSGEEGLLEFIRQPVDLVVTDIHLPGMSGLELMERLWMRRAELKVILLLSEKEAQQIKPTSSDPRFNILLTKPIDTAAFIRSVESCLDLKQAVTVENKLQPEERPPSISDQLSSLRQQLNALAVFLLNDNGKIMAQAGEYSALDPGSPLMGGLLATYSASLKISYLLGLRIPESILCFSGSDDMVSLAPVGQNYALVLVGNRDETGEYFRCTYEAVRPAIGELIVSLGDMGVLAEEVKKDTAELYKPGTASLMPELEKPDEDLEALFAKMGGHALEPEEIDAYWDKLFQERQTGSLNPDALSYEEARRLGLAPDES